MSLKEQVGASLDEITPARATVVRLLASARTHIADAKAPGISAQTRFSAAYTSIRMLADAALNANGYRTLSSRPGHHFTAIQSLTLRCAAGRNGQGAERLAQAAQRLRILGRQRAGKRGHGMRDAAEALLEHVNAWLKAHRPKLL